MTFELPKSLKILEEACALNGVAFAIVDEFSGFVVRLSKGGKSVLAGAAGIGVYPINRAAPFAVARDKAFTHYGLAQAGIAVPKGEHFFLHPPQRWVRPPGRDRADALAYAAALSNNFAKPVVIKPNAGKGAKLVTLVQNVDGLERAFDRIGEEDDLALVQEFIDRPEFRLFLIDGEIAFAYRKLRPGIEGDGASSVRALCLRKIDQHPEALAGLLESVYLNAVLAARGLSLDAVLPAGETLTIDFVANISASGRFAGFVEPHPELRIWARAIARTVSLRVTGIDVFSRSELADPRDFIVTDVNGSPNLGTLYDMGHRDVVHGVWRSILARTFDEPWPEGF